MHIRITRDIGEYRSGQVIETPAYRARAMIRSGCAEDASEAKAIHKPPRNKAIKKPPKSKGSTE